MFDTNKAVPSKPLYAALNLLTPVQYLKGVGPRMAVLLEGKDIRTLRDLLWYLPRDYQDRSTIKAVADLAPEETATVRGTIVRYHLIPIRKLKRPILEAKLQDGQNILSLKWFNYQKGYFEQKFKARPTVLAYGQVRTYNGQLEMLHPDLVFFDADDASEAEAPGILPLYSESEGLTQKFFRKITTQALTTVGPLVKDEIPSTILKAHQLMPLTQALKLIHRPMKDGAQSVTVEQLRRFETPAQRRLIFDDFFKFEWIIGRRRLNMRREHTEGFPSTPGHALLEELKRLLPFSLTEDQLTSIEKIYEDLAQTKPMNRLLQGDVGCGKTLVALAAALPVVAAGGQVALMAPTEILATQHLHNAHKYLEGLKLPSGEKLHVELLVGSTLREPRERILKELAEGKIHVLLGTHALLEPPVIFQKLGLIIIDEQHRFGVDQRMVLRQKGNHPHTLALTATPIPRTLALTAYGDLDVSTIKQLPQGRPVIVTKIIKNQSRPNMYEKVRQELQKGRQAYAIYPLVEESEKMDLANAVEAVEELKQGPLSGFSVGLLHGRLKSQEKNNIMADFKAGKLQALVSTTVVEVGVDVPNATVLIIEHADRFGLSQLHQLRGRIGRGTEASYCFLALSSGHASDVAYQRLQAMEETRDGFKLAELDLEIRGPGEFLGTKQSGELQFPCANLIRDQKILQEARKAAFDLLQDDPELQKPENNALKQYMIEQGALQQARFATA